ncbi:hypothetical protein HU200_049199 [Digitaria exilis]|uniref:GDSL esterase/lipase n=1 Tax=Digitaria exilis TaxID=1010633 RepID=A0A835AQY5_9POAL|nr:hypothetical protein HU200_049199 [Digitaria exilis]
MVMGYNKLAMESFVLCLMIFMEVLLGAAAGIRQPPPMYVFGDSTLDNAGNNIPLSKQVQYMNGTRAKMVAAAGSAAVDTLLAKSFFLIGIGGNDLFAFANAEQARNRSSAMDMQARNKSSGLLRRRRVTVHQAHQLQAADLHVT